MSQDLAVEIIETLLNKFALSPLMLMIGCKGSEALSTMFLVPVFGGNRDMREATRMHEGKTHQ